MIPATEHVERLGRLKEKVRQHQVDAFVVSAEDSIYYLTGLSYKPLERPFFIIVRADAEPVLLVPALEQDHLTGAPNVSAVRRYWDYPSPPGEGWPERLHDLLAGAGRVAVEPSLPMEIADGLRDLAPEALPLVEELRVVKSAAEVQKLRRAAHYADYTVERIFRASYYGVSELELFSQGRSVQLQIMKHEAPWVAEGSTEILAENMLISVEPGIYLPGVGGIRHSDTTLVTRDGYENLTRFPADLDAMTILGRKPVQRLQGALVRRAVGMRN